MAENTDRGSKRRLVGATSATGSAAFFYAAEHLQVVEIMDYKGSSDRRSAGFLPCAGSLRIAQDGLAST